MKRISSFAIRAVDSVLHQVRSLGPYLAIELLLPGGSIVALLLWVYRHRGSSVQRVETVPSFVRQPSARLPAKMSLDRRARSLLLVVRSKAARLLRLVRSDRGRTGGQDWTRASSDSRIAVQGRCG